MRVRDRENIQARKEADRKARKDELRSAWKVYFDPTLPGVSIKNLPTRDGDTALLDEIKSEEIGSIDPTLAESEADKKAYGVGKDAAKQFAAEEPLFYPCKENAQLIAEYIAAHNLPATVESCREAFVKTLPYLKPYPQPSQEKRANDYFEKTVIRSEGRDWTEAELDKLSADRY